MKKMKVEVTVATCGLCNKPVADIRDRIVHADIIMFDNAHGCNLKGKYEDSFSIECLENYDHHFHVNCILKAKLPKEAPKKKAKRKKS